jgi:hypothetical protein
MKHERREFLSIAGSANGTTRDRELRFLSLQEGVAVEITDLKTHPQERSPRRFHVAIKSGLFTFPRHPK